MQGTICLTIDRMPWSQQHDLYDNLQKL